MYCSNCGVGNQAGIFCSECGKAVGQAGAAPAQPVVPASVYSVPPTVSTQPSAPNSSNVLSTLGIISGVVAFLFFPVVFGPIGIVLGGIALARKEKLGGVALSLGILGLVIGMILGAAMYGG
jgi:hypothetical protein